MTETRPVGANGGANTDGPQANDWKNVERQINSMTVKPTLQKAITNIKKAIQETGNTIEGKNK